MPYEPSKKYYELPIPEANRLARYLRSRGYDVVENIDRNGYVFLEATHRNQKTGRILVIDNRTEYQKRHQAEYQKKHHRGISW